ncbi:MAG: protein-glutamate O-methyltransferase CheR [Desulfuromonadaceae bacterium]|nr:protein-glutamate O-methyltransferase CheR [Desulfuromonadaceae bacterium]
MDPQRLEDIEFRLLLEGVFAAYGDDFRNYAQASLKRRTRHWLSEHKYPSLSVAQGEILRDSAVFTSFLQGLTVNVSEMFRDPKFFLALRNQVLPFLSTWPFIRIWVAGCSGGEEVYSLAIVLHEEELLHRCRIYATDINEALLDRARDGIFALRDMQNFTRNYQLAGGTGQFADYYTARYDRALLAAELKQNILFTQHNLAVDADFGEMHLILCRNVLIYFNSTLKERVLGLFDTALTTGGFLCLGMKETLETRSLARAYQELVKGLRIYRKNYPQQGDRLG